MLLKKGKSYDKFILLENEETYWKNQSPLKP